MRIININKRNLIFWLGGFIAFIWILLRSGTNPKRLTYPCQQVAFPIASSWVIAVGALLAGSFIIKLLTRIASIALILVVLGWVMISAIKSSALSKGTGDLPTWQVTNPVSEVFVLDHIPLTPGSLAAGNTSVPDEYLPDLALDSLILIMDRNDLHLYSTGTEDGLIGYDDIVVIKGNFQWKENLGTNTDRIKGLIWKILQHPDGFNGEIIVCDNTQGERNFEECNNSEDPDQSIVDVVNTFSAKGYPVYLVQWDLIMNIQVEEYSSGNMLDGYFYDNSTKISYPKFQSPAGHFISLSKGIWNPENSSYDRSKLVLINFPVTKAHLYTGATLGIKNWVGVMTIADFYERYGDKESMHNYYIFGDYQLTAKIMAETFPDLTIIDGTWTAPSNNFTPSIYNRIRTDMLVASTDPVASSWYTAKYILTPNASYPEQTDPDNTGGLYNGIFRGWSDYLINTAGYDLTYDSLEISVYGRESLAAIPVLSITIEGEGGSTEITVNGGTLQMYASVLPENAADKTVTWSLVNGTGEATISASGLLQAVSEGTVTVMATANDGSGVEGSIDINIINQSASIENSDYQRIRIYMYPVPADDFINIEIESNLPGEFYFRLVSVNGIVLIPKSYLRSSQQIDLSAYNKGLYIIQFYQGEKLLDIKSVVIE